MRTLGAGLDPLSRYLVSASHNLSWRVEEPVFVMQRLQLGQHTEACVKLSQTELRLIDKLAKQDRKLQLEALETSGALPRAGAAGNLNALRAFWMLECLGWPTSSQEKVQAALRKHWPEEWRINERGRRFNDNEFETLALMALIERKGREKKAG